MPTGLYAEFYQDTTVRTLGDTFVIGLRNIHNEQRSPMFSIVQKAVVTVFNSVGAQLLQANLFVFSQNSDGSLVYANALLKTGAGSLVTVAGDYRIVYDFATIPPPNLQEKQWQQTLTLRGVPF
jgi:hypothetical protein